MAKISKFGGASGSGGSFNLNSLFGSNSISGLAKNFSVANSIVGLLSAISKASTKTSKIINYRYRYNVKKFQLILPGEKPIDIINNAVKNISMSWLYDECIHPIMQMVIMLPPKLYNKIIDNKDEAKFVMKIYMTSFDSTNSEVKSDEYINDVFGVVMDDEEKYPEEASYDQKTKAAGENEFNESDYNTEFNLTLWKQSDLDAMRKVVNTIVKDSDVNTSMRKIFGEAGFRKIVMSPMDNNSKYDQIIVMPTNIMNIPDYFEKAYGTYYSGTQMFCDFDRLYILSKNGICDAYEDGEYKRTIFVIKKSTKNDTKRAGTSEDPQSKVYYMFVDTMDISTQSPSTSSDLIEGNNVTIINSNANETMDVSGAGEQNGGGNSRVISDNYGNDYNKSTVLSDINEKNATVTVYTNDYNIKALTPNKEILVVFEEPEKQDKNGFYRIKSSFATLTKEDNDLIAGGKHELVFKKSLTSDESKQILVAVTKKNNTSSGANKVGSGTSSSSTGTSSSGGSSGSSASANNTISNKVRAPEPRFKNMTQDEIITTNNVTPTPMKKNPNFNYDDLGNVKGVVIPSYNIITPDDDESTKRAKQEAQAKKLPADPPKARLQAS